MLNKQIPIKQDLSSPDTLAVNSIFYTIQGEGPFAGEPSVFLRLMGCNLQCPQCDTEYSTGDPMNVWEIIDMIKAKWPHKVVARRPLVVITGGEPFRQNLKFIIDKLIATGFKVQIETNGTLFVDLGWVYASPHLTIVCSPKAGKINRQLEPHIKAYKYVVSADSYDFVDGLPLLVLEHTASPMVARPPQFFDGDVFIQPADEQDEEKNLTNKALAVELALKFGYRLCLQLHKMIGVP